MLVWQNCLSIVCQIRLIRQRVNFLKFFSYISKRDILKEHPCVKRFYSGTFFGKVKLKLLIMHHKVSKGKINVYKLYCLPVFTLFDWLLLNFERSKDALFVLQWGVFSSLYIHTIIRFVPVIVIRCLHTYHYSDRGFFFPKTLFETFLNKIERP